MTGWGGYLCEGWLGSLESLPGKGAAKKDASRDLHFENITQSFHHCTIKILAMFTTCADIERI